MTSSHLVGEGRKASGYTNYSIPTSFLSLPRYATRATAGYAAVRYAATAGLDAVGATARSTNGIATGSVGSAIATFAFGVASETCAETTGSSEYTESTAASGYATSAATVYGFGSGYAPGDGPGTRTKTGSRTSAAHAVV